MRSSYKAFNGEGSASAGGYVGRVMLTGIPKLAIIVRVFILATATLISCTFCGVKVIVRVYKPITAHSS